jgi:alpha-ribazole phosphatase
MQPFALHLLRHGEPERAGRMLGRTNCPSIAAGIEACAARARPLGVEAIVSSDLSRALTAAEEISRSHGLPITVDPRWRELDFGVWDGLAAYEIDQSALGRFWEDPDGNPPPEGERWSMLIARVAAALGDLPSRDTLIVTHGGAMRAALAHLCGLEQRHTWAFELPYTALLSFKVWPGDPPSAQVVGLRA